MATSAIDLSEMLKGIPEGAWVAISEHEHRVIAYAAEIATVMRIAREEGENEPLIVRVPEQSSVLFL